METALYLTTLDDIRDPDRALRPVAFWNMPSVIFEVMFGGDANAQEYCANMYSAAWLHERMAMTGGFARLYFGQEFCELLIPSRRVLEEAFLRSQEMGLSFTYTTGYVTDAGLAALRRNLDWLAEHAAGAEVVVNDWGVLATLADEYPGLAPVLGRLLIKQQRMARYTTDPPPVNMQEIAAPEADIREHQLHASRQLNLSIAAYRERLRDLGVDRFELDIVPQGVDLPPDAWGFGVSCYFPWGYVTSSRNCSTAGMRDPRRSYVVTSAGCSAPCRKLNRAQIPAHFPQTTLQRGNAVFIYHSDYAAPYIRGDIPVDRIVFEPWIPR